MNSIRFTNIKNKIRNNYPVIYEPDMIEGENYDYSIIISIKEIEDEDDFKALYIYLEQFMYKYDNE